MHFGLLSSKADSHPHEHRHRLLGDEKTGESIPSVKAQPAAAGTSRKRAAPYLQRWASQLTAIFAI